MLVTSSGHVDEYLCLENVVCERVQQEREGKGRESSGTRVLPSDGSVIVQGVRKASKSRNCNQNRNFLIRAERIKTRMQEILKPYLGLGMWLALHR